MSIITILYGIILILAMLVLVGKYMYYYFYPNDTVENVIANTSLSNDISLSGQSGKNGYDGVLGELAVNGLNGKHGEKGEIGKSGKKSLIVGSKGFSGNNGSTGPNGSGGSSGIKGSPSNSVIPFVSYSIENDDNIVPLVFEHDFTYNGNIHKLTASFIFDDVTYFSFKNGPTNTQFKIDTSGSDYHTITNGKARRIYANIRVILERRTEGLTSDGTIFYTSSPINRNGYLIASDTDLDKSSKGVERLEEKIIDLNREFGLDFSTIQSSTLSYNYILRGLARYRVIFNIDPPITGVKARLEERFSPNPFFNFEIPSIRTESKSNLIKIKSGEQIYLLSPSFEMGKVVLKDSSNPNLMWAIQNYNNLSDSVTGVNPQLIEAFNEIEKFNEGFKENINIAKTLLVSKKISTDIVENLTVRLKSSEPYPPLTFGQSNLAGSGYKILSTKAEVKDFYLVYPNKNLPISYPSELKSSILHLNFTMAIDVKHFENIKYIVYLQNGNICEITNTNSFVIGALKSIDTITFGYSLPEPNHILQNVNITNNKMFFSDFMGKRIILKFSTMEMNFESRVGSILEYDDSSSTRFAAHPSNENDFENSSSQYDFTSSNHIEGFDLQFSASKFDCFNNLFEVGFQTPAGILKTQKVFGLKQSNGDYILDIPLNGY